MSCFVHVVGQELRKKAQIKTVLFNVCLFLINQTLQQVSIHLVLCCINPVYCFTGSSCISAAHRGVGGVLAFSFRSPRNVAAGTQQCRPAETGQHNTYSLHCVLEFLLQNMLEIITVYQEICVHNHIQLCSS